MTHTTQADRNAELLQLVEGSCNGTLSDEEFARLEERLRDDAKARVFYRRYANLHSALQEYGDVSGRGWYAASIDELNKTSRSRRVMQIVTTCAAVCLVAAAGLLLFNSPPPGDRRPLVGRLESVTGTVTVATTGTAPRVAEHGERIQSADTIETVEAGSSAVILLSDGSRLTLGSKSRLTCDENTALVHRGVVVANVVSRPEGQPFVLTTSHDKLSSGAGSFELSATDERIVLTVAVGRVAVSRIATGESIDVAAGQRLVGRRGSPFQLEQSATVVWSADFEHGLPAGWRLGRFVKSGLPRGSRGGVEAVTARVQEGVYHSIAGPERRETGLFRFEPNLHVHVTLKMSQPGWINIFLFTKKNQPGKSLFAGNYLFNEVPFREMKPGRWYSLVIPITKFRRLFPSEGGQFEGVIPYQLAFSSKGPTRGLVIDELRITRGGPGRVELNEVK